MCNCVLPAGEVHSTKRLTACGEKAMCCTGNSLRVIVFAPYNQEVPACLSETVLSQKGIGLNRCIRQLHCLRTHVLDQPEPSLFPPDPMLHVRGASKQQNRIPSIRWVRTSILISAAASFPRQALCLGDLVSGHPTSYDIPIFNRISVALRSRKVSHIALGRHAGCDHSARRCCRAGKATVGWADMAHAVETSDEGPVSPQ